LSKTPEIRATQNNIKVANFDIAVERRFVKDGEERQTDFFPVVAWNKLGEFCEKYLQKGTKVVIEGRLEVRQWQDKDGNNRYTTEVIAESIEFAESKKQDNTQSTNDIPVNVVENSSSDDLPF
jgi:single-strand DNA-binding protein